MTGPEPSDLDTTMRHHILAPCSRLLALPAELREEVWKTVLEGVVIELPTERNLRIAMPALTYTSRQVRAETIPVFLGHSIFDGPYAVMVKFFAVIGRPNVELLRHIRHSQHVGLNTLQAIRLTLRILGDAYESIGLRQGALEFPLFVEDGTRKIWVTIKEAEQLEQVRQGAGISKPPIVRWVGKESANVQVA